MKKILLILTALIGFSAISQNNPALFRNGVETKFIALDTLTTVQRDALTLKSSKGYVIFNADTNVLNLYDGTSWGEIGATPDLSAYQLKPSEGAFVDGDKDNLDNLVTADSNNVKITGDQTISGVKTFTSPPLLEQGALYKPFTGAFVFNPTGGSFFYGGASKYTFSQNNDDLGALAERYATFDFSNLTGATSEEKIYTFPDASGTIALTSDIPTAINAANVIVSPAIGGDTDGQAVMTTHETRIDVLEASTVNPASLTVTYSSSISNAYTPAQPNRNITLAGNSTISVTGATSGDSGIWELFGTGDATLNNSVGSDLVVTLSGTKKLVSFWVDKDDNLTWYDSTPSSSAIPSPIVHDFTGGEASYNFGTAITTVHQIFYGTTTSPLLLLWEGTDYTKSGSTITFIGFTALANDRIVYYSFN